LRICGKNSPSAKRPAVAGRGDRIGITVHALGP